MSRVNGDKARFNRERKRKIHRREQKRKMLEALPAASSGTPAPSGARTKVKS